MFKLRCRKTISCTFLHCNFLHNLITIQARISLKKHNLNKAIKWLPDKMQRFQKGMVFIMKKYDFAIVGGDKRTACMAQVLAQKGYNVICFGTVKYAANDKIHYSDTLRDAIIKAPVIVCGIPFEKDGGLYFEKELPKISLTELQRLLRKHHKIFGGVISEDFKRICEKRNIGCFDFMQEEPLTIFNAAATAEGAILEALLHKDTQLHHSKVLVLGYGRCGKVLADKLKGLSAQITVCSAQAEELALADSLGFSILKLSELSRQINSFEYVFNTIPAKVLTKECLKEMKNDALIIDIASNRTGVDYEAANLLKRHVEYCPGLPGKYAPLSCAEKLTEFVLSKI